MSHSNPVTNGKPGNKTGGQTERSPISRQEKPPLRPQHQVQVHLTRGPLRRTEVEPM